MNKNNRIFYLDFIRALAVLLIIITHYNAVFIFQWNEELLKKIVITWKIANLYIGDFGVSLFLIVSGAALMSVYEKQLNLKEFYKKRFMGIYPMYWIAYFAVFMYSFWLNKGINQGIPKINIIFSILGMDFYLCEAIATFCMVGEWFLGFIIIFYMVFPLIRKGIEKVPVITAIAAFAMYIFFMMYYPLPMTRSTWLFIRLPELLFGMYFIKYKVKLTWRKAVIAGIILILNTVFQPTIDKDIQTIYIGISAFILFGYIGSILERKAIIVRICKGICKYSYPVFLIHHYIINRITSQFDLYSITILESYLLFILCCCVIAFFSKLLYDANAYVISNVKARRI